MRTTIQEGSTSFLYYDGNSSIKVRLNGAHARDGDKHRAQREGIRGEYTIPHFSRFGDVKPKQSERVLLKTPLTWIRGDDKLPPAPKRITVV
mgnify:CR=1 FL=1